MTLSTDKTPNVAGAPSWAQDYNLAILNKLPSPAVQINERVQSWMQNLSVREFWQSPPKEKEAYDFFAIHLQDYMATFNYATEGNSESWIKLSKIIHLAEQSDQSTANYTPMQLLHGIFKNHATFLESTALDHLNAHELITSSSNQLIKESINVLLASELSPEAIQNSMDFIFDVWASHSAIFGRLSYMNGDRRANLEDLIRNDNHNNSLDTLNSLAARQKNSPKRLLVFKLLPSNKVLKKSFLSGSRMPPSKVWQKSLTNTIAVLLILPILPSAIPTTTS